MTVAAATATMLVLGGCGAGQEGHIGFQVAAVNGGTGEVGQIAVLDAKMLYPPSEAGSEDAGSGLQAVVYATGDDVPLIFTLTNAGVETADELVSITTPAAESVEITGSTAIPAKSSISTLDPSQFGADSATSSAPPSAQAEVGTELNGSIAAEITGLTRDILPGPSIDVTFTFERAGELTLPVPLAAPSESETEPES